MYSTKNKRKKTQVESPTEYVLTNERRWLSGCVAIVHVLQIYSCLVHSDVVKESTFYTDDEVFFFCVEVLSVCFCSFFESQAPEYVVQFLSNRAGKYRAWLQKDAHHLFFFLLLLYKVLKNLEVQLGKTGGTVIR